MLSAQPSATLPFIINTKDLHLLSSHICSKGKIAHIKRRYCLALESPQYVLTETDSLLSMYWYHIHQFGEDRVSWNHEIPTGRDHTDSIAPSRFCCVDNKLLKSISFHNSCFIRTNQLTVRFTDIHNHLDYTWEMLAASELSVTCFTEEVNWPLLKKTFSWIKKPFKLELYMLKKIMSL